MANRNKPINQSRVIRNINAAANHHTVRTTGKYAAKGINKTAKWLTTDHTTTSYRGAMTNLQQSVNYNIAGIKLSSRRMQTRNDLLHKQMQTGIQTSAYEVARGWVVDHLIYVMDLLGGFIQPILSAIFWSIFQIVVIIVVNIIFFYGLYLLLTS